MFSIISAHHLLCNGAVRPVQVQTHRRWNRMKRRTKRLKGWDEDLLSTCVSVWFSVKLLFSKQCFYFLPTGTHVYATCILYIIHIWTHRHTHPSTVSFISKWNEEKKNILPFTCFVFIALFFCCVRIKITLDVVGAEYIGLRRWYIRVNRWVIEFIVLVFRKNSCFSLSLSFYLFLSFYDCSCLFWKCRELINERIDIGWIFTLCRRSLIIFCFL